MQRATEARERTIIGQEKETISLAWDSLMTDKITKGIAITNTLFQEELNKNGNNVTVTLDDEGNYLVRFSDTGHTYKVDKYENITLVENNIVAENEDIETTETIYVTLYSDGTLALSNNNITDSSKTITKTYTIEKNDLYESADVVPWKNERSSINKAVFVNEIIPASTARWFEGCSNLSTIENIQNLNTINVTNMRGMFSTTNLTNIDLSHFDTRKVTDMGGLFYSCSKIKSLNLSKFDTRKVTDMCVLFEGCSALTNLDLSSFNTSNVTDMNGMFQNCSSLTSLNVSNFDTVNVTDMHSMFKNCSNLTNLDVSSFNTNNVTNMHGMFFACNSLTRLDLCSFDTSKVTDMESMFSNEAGIYSKYETIDLSGKFDTSKVQNTRWMFANCNKLKIIYATDKFVINAVTDGYEMFLNCSSIKGGNGTTYRSDSMTYARIDKSGQAGYFTYRDTNISKNMGYVTDGLVFHLDGIYNVRTEHSDSTTTWKDMSGNEINATLGNGCTITNNGINMNKSMSAIITLNNSNIINAFNNSTNGFTVSMLVNIESNTEEYQTLFHCGTKGENYKVRSLITHKDNKMAFSLYYNDIKVDFSNYFNKMTLIDCVYENGYKKIYIDGNLLAQNASEGFENVAPDSVLYIGDTVYEGNFYGRAINGCIYSARLYSQALSASQIKTNYDKEKERYGF